MKHLSTSPDAMSRFTAKISPISNNKKGNKSLSSTTKQRHLESILFPASSHRKAKCNSHSSDERQSRTSKNISTFINLTKLIMQNQKDDEQQTDDLNDEDLEEYSLCFIHRDNKFRQYLHEHIIHHRYFDRLVLFVISLNIIFLSLDDPTQSTSSSNLQFAVFIVEIISTVFYVIETCLKVLTYGLIMGKKSYLHDKWNQIDFVVVCSSVLELILRSTLNSENDSSSILIQWIGIGKVLRPLRFLAIVPDLQILLQQFVDALPLLTNAFVLLAFLFLIWGLVGVQLFSGKLRYRCQNDLTFAFDEVNNTRPTQQPNCGQGVGARHCPNGYSCVYTETNPNFGLSSFDNLGVAVLGIFVSVTMEKWTVLMYRIQSAFNFWTWPYFVLLIIFGSFFVVNLTLVAIKAQMLDSEESNKRISMVVEQTNQKRLSIREQSKQQSDQNDNNNEHGIEIGDEDVEEEEEKQECFLYLLKNEWMEKNLISKAWFDNFFMACIGINTLMLTIEHHGQPKLLDDILAILNYIFTALFLLEMVLKIAGSSIKGYVADTFNIFDGLIALISLFEVLISSGAGFLSATRIFRLARVFRMARVFRVMKIVRYLEAFQQLIKVVKQSIRSIAFISALLLIFIFMYAMLGFQLFRGKYYFAEDVAYNIDAIPRANFESLYWSFVTCFQLLTLEEWVNIMYDGVRASSGAAMIYFISFVVIGCYCLLNMFLAIVLQNFEADHRKRLEAKIKKQRELDAIKALNPDISGIDENKQQITTLSTMKTLQFNNSFEWKYLFSCRKKEQQQITEEDGDDKADNIKKNVLLSPSAIALVSPDDIIQSKPKKLTILVTPEIKSRKHSLVLRQSLSSIGNQTNTDSRNNNPGTGSRSHSAFQRRNSRWQAIRKSIEDGKLDIEEDDSDDFLCPSDQPKRRRMHSICSTDIFSRPIRSRQQSLLSASLQSKRAFGGLVRSNTHTHGFTTSNSRSKSISVRHRKPTTSTSSYDRSLNLLALISRHKTRMNEDSDTLSSSDSQSQSLVGTDDDDDDDDSKNKDEDKVNAFINNSSPSLKRMQTIKAKQTTKSIELFPEELLLENHIFSHYSWYRNLRHFILCDTFQSFILLLIVISSINLAVDTPSMTGTKRQIIDTLDTVLVIIFTLEMILKIFVMGLVGMDGAYLNESWNQLDAAIVITSLISNLGNDGILGTFRVLRAFRPLRIAARYEELRIVLTALGRSLPAMLNVFGVLLFFWLIFGILSVQLFGGKFYDCYGLDAATYAKILSHGIGATDILKCESFEGGTWSNPDYHFDNILDALKSLFVISTLEGWHTIMYHAVDATGIDQLPSKNASKMSALFFILFILIGSFFLISLFVGIIFDNFVKLRDEATGVGMLTIEQRQWVALQTKIVNAKPIHLPLPPSLYVLKQNQTNGTKQKLFTNMLHNIDLSQPRKEDNNFRGRCYYIGISAQFEKLMMLCICLNIGVMCFTFEGESDAYSAIFEAINTVFTFVFLVEAAIKIIGFGLRQYFQDIWNKFDFFIVIGALFEFIMDYMMQNNADSTAQNTDITFLRILRVFRVSRLVRIVKSAERLKSLMRTLVKSCSSLLSIGLLLGLMYFVSAILAMNIFYDIDLEKGKCINSQSNFHSFFNSLLTMFRVSTGEDWDCIMADCCNASIGGFSSCWLFFMLFYLTVSFVTLNLFIAIILQAFDPNDTSDAESNSITDDMIAEFIDSWSYFDPMATGYVDYSSFEHFLQKIRRPMGIGKNGTRVQMYQILHSCEIIVHDDNKLNFTEVLYSLSERVDGCYLNEESKVYNKINKQLARKFDLFGENKPSLGVLLAVTKAQRIWKKKLEQKRERERNAAMNKEKEEEEEIKKKLIPSKPETILINKPNECMSPRTKRIAQKI